MRGVTWKEATGRKEAFKKNRVGGVRGGGDRVLDLSGWWNRVTVATVH